jgi:hypothetical protein
MLHPGVRGQDEKRRQVRPDRHQPDAGQVREFRQPVPAEYPQADERGLQEECDQRLDRQRRTEDITDEPRVVAPIHTELELLNNTGNHTHPEVDEEQLPPKLRHMQILWIAGPIPHRLHQRDQERQTDRQRDKQEMIDGDDTELPPSKVEGIHA